ncbi:Receptor-like protein 48 [Linum perenne]
MQVMNLRANEFSREILDCWTSWRYLEAIMLSSNKFRGSIPQSLGTLSFLQSLYLRNNNLSGEIPPSLENITMFPLSTQLQSLNSSSFAGNKDLCSSPLAKKCRIDSTTIDSNRNGRGS